MEQNTEGYYNLLQSAKTNKQITNALEKQLMRWSIFTIQSKHKANAMNG